MESFHPLYVKFIYYFNIKKDYYECHEVLEELWIEEGRPPLYQGLLQGAVALYHFSNGNVSGAIKLFRGALQKLSAYEKIELGIDLEQFRNECENVLERLKHFEERPFEFVPFQIQIVDQKLRNKVESML